jgi:hypothetical protein
MTLEEIEATLRDENSGLREMGGRRAGNFTVAMLAVANPELLLHPLSLVGTGTLVTVNDVHYILTAAHVWKAVQERGSMLGLTLAEDKDHEFLIPNVNIVASVTKYDPASVDWGPDLVFLRIPPERLGTLKAYKNFYNLSIERASRPLDCIKTNAVIGTPGEMAEQWPRYAVLQVTAFFLETNPKRITRGNFDYLEYTVDMNFPGVPSTFGGVSGGGLWEIYFYFCEKTQKIETIERLIGVAYAETAVVQGHREIRFHGYESMRASKP